jgi:hypothetical protein
MDGGRLVAIVLVEAEARARTSCACVGNDVRVSLVTDVCQPDYTELEMLMRIVERAKIGVAHRGSTKDSVTSVIQVHHKQRRWVD